MIPLILDLRNRRVCIFGGGGVGLRKAAFFAGESDVTVISRSFLPGFEILGVECRTLDITAASDDDLCALIRGAFLVIAATSDRDLNDRIGALCTREGILFNNADGEAGDVIIPSVVRGDHYLVAITTLGKSPGVARYLRMRIRDEWKEIDPMIELQAEMRDRLKETEPSQGLRSDIIWKMLGDPEVWDALRHDRDAARTLARRKYCP
ncbi:MAG: bifunctional precorrin-2 dehydrogenase/sirohydrochlorin ferrochelatase [Methanomicrobiaceae archaeon]|nr:bifunctional precorrin-2 dehydrogenase/sirohydrochlorin ferrochelatase [Methanomicrobiaceae archaeon]